MTELERLNYIQRLGDQILALCDMILLLTGEQNMVLNGHNANDQGGMIVVAKNIDKALTAAELEEITGGSATVFRAKPNLQLVPK
jgi:hypothetical protein